MLALPMAFVMLSDGQQATAIATVVSSAIAGGVMLVTQQSSAKRAAQSVQLTSRTDIEKEAFERAKAYYTDVIDRQQAEIRDLEGEITGCKGRLQRIERERAEEIAALKAHRDRLLDELEAAKTALALKYPDE